jgi:hypothetical protein
MVRLSDAGRKEHARIWEDKRSPIKARERSLEGEGRIAGG